MSSVQPFSAYESTLDFIDFDNDGDVDIALTGSGLTGVMFKILINNGQSGPALAFTELTPTGLTSVRNAKLEFGDFNGDGFEDFAVAWAYFPHTIEPSQKVNAPLNIYLNDGNGRLMENLDIYQSGTPTNHPFAYRTIAADFNGDGEVDIKDLIVFLNLIGSEVFQLCR